MEGVTTLFSYSELWARFCTARETWYLERQRERMGNREEVIVRGRVLQNCLLIFVTIREIVFLLTLRYSRVKFSTSTSNNSPRFHFLLLPPLSSSLLHTSHPPSPFYHLSPSPVSDRAQSSQLRHVCTLPTPELPTHAQSSGRCRKHNFLRVVLRPYFYHPPYNSAG